MRFRRVIRLLVFLGFATTVVGAQKTHAQPDERTLKAAMLVVAIAKGAASACNISDNGGWDAAMAYLETLPMSQRKKFEESLTGGVGGGMSISRDRNFPAVCRSATVTDMIKKADWARQLLLRESARQ
jgi:hypothetical protein